MHRTTASRAGIPALLAATLVLASCGGGDTDTADPGSLPSAATDLEGGFDELVERAQNEGEVMFYTGTDEEYTQEWVAGFEDKYGIEVEIFRASSNPLYQRWSQETAAGEHRADALAMATFQLMANAAGDGRLARYTTQQADSFPENNWPADADVGGAIDALYLTREAVAFNTEVTTVQEQQMLREDPYGALLDPAFQGRISVNDPGGSSDGAYANMTINQADEYGWEYLEQLAEQDPAVFSSGIPQVQALVAGEFAVAAVGGTDTITGREVVNGAPVEFVYPETPAATLWGLGTPAEAPHPYAARLFREWATTLEAQTSLAILMNGAVTHTGWVDEREITRFDWYEPPAQVWLEWRDHPELSSEEQVGDFSERILRILGAQ